MGLFGKNKDINTMLTTNEKIGNISAGNAIKITAMDTENKVEIKMPFAKKGTPSVYLAYSQITRVEHMAETQVIEYQKNKSVVGRAIGGGLLLGPLGATIGAISGVGSDTKQKKDYTFYVIINYISSGGEVEAMTFTIPNATLNADKFIKHLKAVCELDSKVIQEEINL